MSIKRRVSSDGYFFKPFWYDKLPFLAPGPYRPSSQRSVSCPERKLKKPRSGTSPYMIVE